MSQVFLQLFKLSVPEVFLLLSKLSLRIFIVISFPWDIRKKAFFILIGLGTTPIYCNARPSR